jgi:cation transport ATPase
VRSGFLKTKGVEKAEINLKDGRADLALKPKNQVTPEQISQVVKKAGFTAKGMRVNARGVFAKKDEELIFILLETPLTYRSVVAKGVGEPPLGKPVIVTGTLAAPFSPKVSLQIVTIHTN